MFFLQITEVGPGTLPHLIWSSMSFMIMDKGYILDVVSFQGLFLYHVTMLFIGLVLCKKISFVTGSIFVKYYSVKSFFNVFEMRLHKYKSFWGHLIYLNIRTLHKAKTYAKIFTPFQIITISRVINLITSLVCIYRPERWRKQKWFRGKTFLLVLFHKKIWVCGKAKIYDTVVV